MTARWWRLSCSFCEQSILRWYGPEGKGPTHRCMGFVKPFDEYEMTSQPGHSDGPPRGERAPNAKLTAEKVIAIRNRYSTDPTATVRGLAREYGVHTQTLSHVLSGRSWKHVARVTIDGVASSAEVVSVLLGDGRTVPLSAVSLDQLDISAPARLNPDIVREIRRAKGSLTQLSERFGISRTTIANVINRKTWRDVEDDEGEQPMAPTTLTQIPARVDLHLFAGDKFTMYVTVTDGGAPVDITGQTFKAEMDDGTVFTITPVTGETGRLALSTTPKPFARTWALSWEERELTLLAGKVCVEGDPLDD